MNSRPTWAIQRAADVIIRTKSSNPSVHRAIWTSCHPSKPALRQWRRGSLGFASSSPAKKAQALGSGRDPVAKEMGGERKRSGVLCASIRVHRFTPIRALSHTLTQAHMHTHSNKCTEKVNFKINQFAHSPLSLCTGSTLLRSTQQWPSLSCENAVRSLIEFCLAPPFLLFVCF